MITWEQIQAVNAEIKTVPISGKDYAEVPERIKAFRKLYPEGFIRTTVQLDGKACIVHATVGFYKDGVEHILGEGTGREVEGSSFINRGSHVENAETSAVGRAIGFLGLLGGPVASFEEVANAKVNQGKSEKIDAMQAAILTSKASEDGIPLEYLAQLCKVPTVGDITIKKMENLLTNWDKVKEGAKKNA